MKSVVLLSAGLDSTVNLYESCLVSECLLALTFDYGQRAAPKEIERASQLCEKLKLRHKVLELPWFKDFTHTSLVESSKAIPRDMDINSESQTQASASAVWVPNRNGIFMNIGAAYAEGLGADYIVPGFNFEEAQTFADNTKEFLDQCSAAFSYSTNKKVMAKCFTVDMTKPEIAERGKQLGVDFSLIWPCYFGDPKPCGRCESCLRFERAKRESGI